MIISSLDIKNAPISLDKNAPLDSLVQCGHYRKDRRRYTSKRDIEDLSINIFRKTRSGIIYRDLLEMKLAVHKVEAQRTLKYYRRRGILFTSHLTNKKPQTYYPTKIKSEVIEKLAASKIGPVYPTAVNQTSHGLSCHRRVNHNPLWNALQHQRSQSFLEVLTALAYFPIYIHKLQLVLSIDKQYYLDLSREERLKNRAKIHEENIGRRHVIYTLYPRGRVEVAIATSDTPFRLQTDEDESVIFSFLGQVRDRLIYLLQDILELNVPPIMGWILKGCDVNKDIEIDIDKCQLVFPDIQLTHADRVFRLYVKLLAGKAFYRGEESLSLNGNIPVIEALDNIRHPYKSIEAKLDKLMNAVNDFNIYRQEQDRQKRELGQ